MVQNFVGPFTKPRMYLVLVTQVLFRLDSNLRVHDVVSTHWRLSASESSLFHFRSGGRECHSDPHEKFTFTFLMSYGRGECQPEKSSMKISVFHFRCLCVYGGEGWNPPSLPKLGSLRIRTSHPFEYSGWLDQNVTHLCCCIGMFSISFDQNANIPHKLGNFLRSLIGGSRISQMGRGANPWGGGGRGFNPLFGKFFAKNCIKLKEIGTGACVPSNPLDPQMELALAIKIY